MERYFLHFPILDSLPSNWTLSILVSNSVISLSLFTRCIRYIVFHWLPKSMQDKALIKDAKYRPQLTWLPLAPKRGTGPVFPQKPSKRYEEELRKKQEEAENRLRENQEREE